MLIIRSSRLYLCYCRVWCVMPWLLVVGCYEQSSRLCVRDEGNCVTAVAQFPSSRTHSLQNEKYQCRIDTVSSPDDGHIVARNM